MAGHIGAELKNFQIEIDEGEIGQVLAKQKKAAKKPAPWKRLSKNLSAIS